ATLNTPRLLDVKVLPASGSSKFLCCATSIAQGEELGAIARLGPEDKELPKSLRVIGSLDGEPFEQQIAVPAEAPQADYLPRTWAKLEIDRLVAIGADANRDAIIALSKAMYVMSPFTSLLVLENEEMYERFKVDRGRKDHWAPYVTPQKIP